MDAPRLPALVIACCLTAACATGGPAPGGTEPVGNGSPGPTATGSGTGTATGTGGGATIEVAATWTGAEQATFEQVLAAFTEASGIEVTYTPVGTDPGAVLTPRAQGGAAPDVALLPQPGLLLDFARQGLTYPVGPEVERAVDEHYDPTWKELATVEGELHGVFYKAANKSLVWYSTEVFERAALDPPGTWEELLGTADALEPSGIPPLAVAGADAWVLTDWFENLYVEEHGIERYEQLARHELPWDDPSVVATLERLAVTLTDPELVAGGVEETLQTDFPTSVTRPFLSPPEAAMVFEGDFAAGVIGDETEAEPGKTADFFPFPAIGEDDRAVVVGGDVAVLMRDSDGGRRFLAFLATPEAGQVWAEAGGFISPNRSLPTDGYGDPVAQRAAEMLHDAEAIAFDLSDRQPAAFGATVGDGLYRVLQDLLEAPGRVRELAAELEQLATEAYRTSAEAEVPASEEPAGTGG